MGFYSKHILPGLITCACSSKPIMKQRAKVVPLAEGRVLEIGCGSGTNFGLYNQDKVETLFALEPAKEMIIRAKKVQSELPGLNTEFIEAGAEDIPLGNDSIDTVMLTYTLCTIPDWESALSEIRRVIKPGGRILFAEHGLSPDEGVAKWQKRWNPIQNAIGGGCHVTRDPKVMMEDSGYQVDRCENMYLPSTPKVLGYQFWGEARIA